MYKLSRKIKVLYVLIIFIFIAYFYFRPNIDNQSLEHIKNVERVEVYQFKDIKKFNNNNNNKLLLEINSSESLNNIIQMLSSTHIYQEKVLEKDIENKYALKIFTEDSHYLMFLFLGDDTYKKNFINIYGYDILYFIEDYSSVIEFKKILDNI